MDIPIFEFAAISPILWSISMFLIVLGVLITVHEFGHYLAARSVGIRVLTFSIGFGPEIFGWNDKSGTRWKLSWIPLGGYVAMYGFDGSEVADNAKDRGEAYAFKPVWARMWAVFAGPLMNFVFAFVALSALFMAGEERLQARVGSLVPDMPAIEAGLLEGDLIQSINGTQVKDFFHLSKLVSGEFTELELVIERNGTQQQILVTPVTRLGTDELGTERTVGRIGVGPDYDATERVEHSIPSAVTTAAAKTWEMTSLTVRAIAGMVTGKMSADGLAGPISIAQTSGEVASYGLYPLVMFMVLISINLGLLNLLPIPVLDGGHLLFLALEALRGGKKLSEQAEGYAYRAGIAVLGALMVFAFYNDISRLILQ